MTIQTLKLSAFRCFEQADFQLSPGINVFTGINGSGKTSILEAVHFLSTGKSFRTPQNKTLIKKGEDDLSVYASIENNQQIYHLGSQLNKSSSKTLKVNHQKVQKQTQLASTMPTLCIDPNSYLFCDNSPQFRRSFLDWMVFHVKHDYIKIWSQVVKIQKHINHLLKNKQTSELKLWLAQYVKVAESVNQYREKVFHQFQLVFEKLSQDLIPSVDSIELSYFPGWSQDLPLSEILNNEINKYLMYGQLRHGVHRMDIQMKSSSQAIKHTFSRGQKKMTALICYLSCLQVMDKSSDNHSVLCLDDFDAELDAFNAQHFYQYLKTLPNQILISTVDNNRYSEKEATMFHVKHSK